MTASFNYKNAYEICNFLTRDQRNHWVLENTGLLTSSISFNESYWDYAKPEHGSSQNIVVCKFSSPGEPGSVGDADGGETLDVETAQYSPYNTINFRNKNCRFLIDQNDTRNNTEIYKFTFGEGATSNAIFFAGESLSFFIKGKPVITSEITDEVEQAVNYGSDSNPKSRYKHQKIAYLNLINAIKQNKEYDGYHFWIEKVVPADPGFIHSASICFKLKKDEIADIRYSDDVDASYSYNYITESIGFYKTNVNNRFRMLNDSGTLNGEFLTSSIDANAFVQFNIPTNDRQYKWIREGLSASFNGYANEDTDIPMHSSSFEFEYNTASIPVGDGSNFYNIPYRSWFALWNYSTNNIYYNLSESCGHWWFRHSLNKRSAGDTNWQRRDISNHPHVRFLKNNSLVGVETNQETPVVFNFYTGSSEQFGVQYYSASSFIQNYPTFHTIVKDGENFEFKYTLHNDSELFGNDILDTIYGFSQQNTQNYNNIFKLYNDGDYRFKSLKTKYQIFPQHKYVGFNKNNYRTDYVVSDWWDDNRLTRTQAGDILIIGPFTSISDTVTNIYDENVLSQSIWPLDSRENFESADDVWSLDAGYNTGSGEGVLMNTYTIFGARSYPWLSSVGNLKNAPLYARRSLVYSSLQAQMGGEAKWETGEQTNSNPFDSSYKKFAKMLKLFGNDYTLVPEYRVSEHIDKYINEFSGNIFKEDTGSLSLTGSQYSYENCDRFTHSDDLSFFTNINQDHENISHKNKIKIKCDTLCQFLPYDGFYPVQKTTELAELFSSSFGPYVTGSSNDNYAQTTRTYFRPFIQPMFAPGIMFNTVKSGLAVDYPVYTSSFDGDVNITDFYTDVDNWEDHIHPYPVITSGSVMHDRIPFEAIIEPKIFYAPKANLYDVETHLSSTLAATASWGGVGKQLYSMAANNFFAEVPRFFLKQAALTTIESLPDDSPEFGIVNGEFDTYEMLVVLTTNNFVNFESPEGEDNFPYESGTVGSIMMYNHGSAFGPRCANYFYLSDYVDDQEGYRMGYAPYTPPYFSGPAFALIKFVPDQVRKYTLNEIFASSSIEYHRYGKDTWADFEGGPSKSQHWYEPKKISNRLTSDNKYVSSNNRMEISASLNIFSKIKDYTSEFDENGKLIKTYDSKGEKWVIQTKFETPILNFKNTSYSQCPSGKQYVGMWHQYGEIPQDNEGLYMYVMDLPDYMKKDITSLGFRTGLTGSLADLVGFSKTVQKVGEIEDKRIVKESIVAVPYREIRNDKHYFKISLDKAREKQLFDKMDDYIMPPKFDIKRNPVFQNKAYDMYFFEFEFDFDKDDLSLIWQNVAPKQHQEYQKKSLELELEPDFPLDANIKWEIFKVKQRAKNNYWKTIAENARDKRFNFDYIKARKGSQLADETDYSYNWPYDYFSMIELVKMDIEITLSNDDEGGEQ